MIGLRPGPTQDAPAGQLRPGLRIYAIGDIHGHADLLDRMAALVLDDLDRRPVREAVTVFIGDYIDRGPASSAVIERLVRRQFATPIVGLRGNHEQMFLDCLDDVGALELWLMNGGAATVESYGLALDRYTDVLRFRDAVVNAMPDPHLDFLRGTELSLTVDGYYFVHAGILPGIPLERQRPDDMLWIRRPFHLSTADHGKVVVHGHTPVSKPDSLPNRINIDTGAFRTGRLSCAALEGGERRFLST